MNYLKYLFLIIATGLLWSCEDFLLTTCHEGNGNFQVEKRAVSGFSGVVSSVSYDVEVTYDTIQTLSVQADENLLEYISTVVRGGNLYIETRNNDCIENNDRVKVKITCPYIEALELLGSGELDAYGFNRSNIGNLRINLSGSGSLRVANTVANSVVANNSGSGQITLDGKANSADYSLSGLGGIGASNFPVSFAYANLSGSGDIELRALTKLEIIISGSGDLFYYGSPTLNPSPIITGSGNYFGR